MGTDADFVGYLLGALAPLVSRVRVRLAALPGALVVGMMLSAAGSGHRPGLACV